MRQELKEIPSDQPKFTINCQTYIHPTYKKELPKIIIEYNKQEEKPRNNPEKTPYLQNYYFRNIPLVQKQQ